MLSDDITLPFPVNLPLTPPHLFSNETITAKTLFLPFLPPLKTITRLGEDEVEIAQAKKGKTGEQGNKETSDSFYERTSL